MKKCVNFLSLVLIVIGALNWGLWGFFQFDLVAWLAGGNTSMLSRLIYAIVGLAGVVGLGFFSKCRHLCCCNKGKCGCSQGNGKSGSSCCK